MIVEVHGHCKTNNIQKVCRHAKWDRDEEMHA